MEKTSSPSWATISILRQLFASHVPDTLVTDNGPCFANKEFETFMMANGIKHMRTAHYQQVSNGLVERAVQTIENGLRKFTSGPLELRLARLLLQYRITPHATAGVFPSELLMGWQIQSQLDLVHPGIMEHVSKCQNEQAKGKGSQIGTFSVGEKHLV